MDKRPTYIQELDLLSHVRERSGKSKNHPEIMKLYKEAGHEWPQADEVPWCAAAVNTMLKRGGYKYVKSLGARDTGRKLPGTRNNTPKRWDVGVMWTRSKNSYNGHIGFVVKADRNWVWLYGGNQSNGVNVKKYPRRKFEAFITPEKAIETPSQMAKVSRKMSTSETTKYALGTGGIAAWFSYENLTMARDFMQDNAGLMVLGVAGITVLVMHLLGKWQMDDYKQGRYTPSGSDA